MPYSVFDPEPNLEPPDDEEPCPLCGEYGCSCYEKTEPEDIWGNDR